MDVDSLIDEIHQTRREISDRFDGDVAAIAKDAACRQAASTRPVWKPDAASKAVNPSSETTVSGKGQLPSTAE